MSPVALAMMIMVCGLIWGGFGVLLVRAVREEGKKASARIDEHAPRPSP